jgi:hypothetical protein
MHQRLRHPPNHALRQGSLSGKIQNACDTTHKILGVYLDSIEHLTFSSSGSLNGRPTNCMLVTGALFVLMGVGKDQ